MEKSNEKKSFILCFVFCVILFASLCANIFYFRRNVRFRNQINELEIRYASAMRDYTEIANRNRRITDYTGELSRASKRNIESIDDAIETVRDLRKKIEVLENYMLNNGISINYGIYMHDMDISN